MDLLKYRYSVGSRRTSYSYTDQARHDYYFARSDIRNQEELLQRLTETETNIDSYFYSSETIRPFDVPFGSSIKMAKLILGKPTYKLESSKIPNHVVIYYKKRVDSIPYLLQLHYIDDELVYAMNNISENMSLTKNHLIEMTRLHLHKYTQNLQEEIDTIHISIVDSKENRITVSDSLGFNIRYSNGSALIKAQVNELMEQNAHQSIKEKLLKKTAMLNFL